MFYNQFSSFQKIFFNMNIIQIFNSDSMLLVFWAFYLIIYNHLLFFYIAVTDNFINT